MQERFGLPLALVIIDALMPAAQFKDADKSTEARQVMDMLAAVAREFEVLVVLIDHFGKDVSTGTRNASTKEDAAETILALLGERSLEGKLSNPRMALRKVKGAEQGVEFPFEPREVAVGETTTVGRSRPSSSTGERPPMRSLPIENTEAVAQEPAHFQAGARQDARRSRKAHAAIRSTGQRFLAVRSRRCGRSS